MTVSIQKNINSSIAVLMLAFAFGNINHANALQSGSLSDVEDILNDGIPGANAPNNNYTEFPDGSETDYEYSHTEDGISIEGSYRYGFHQDFSEYVNTSAKTVKVLDLTTGVNAGISLGCSGLDMGLESLFKFDASDFLDDLKSYATTKLATEALAMIYATPLISTVMDGIKSMNNFVAEFEQASCNMDDVMDRADEIKGKRIKDCIAEKTRNGVAGDAANQECRDPGALVRSLQKLQCTMSTRASTSESLSSIFGTSFGGPTRIEGDSGTVGGFISSLIPDIKFKSNGGNRSTLEEKNALRPIEEVNDRANAHSYNTIVGVYNDIIKSLDRKSISSIKERNTIIRKVQKYKDHVLRYGSSQVFEDTSSENKENISSSQIDTIRGKFKSVSKHQFKTIKAATGYSEFLIGPMSGPSNGAISSSATSFQSAAKDLMLRAGELCFSKQKDLDSSKYKWARVHKNPEAIISLDNLNLDAQPLIDATTERTSICKALDLINLNLLHTYMEIDEGLAESYIQYRSAEAGYQAAELIAKVASDKLTYGIANNEALLANYCSKNGGAGAMEATAASPSGSSCNLPATDSQGRPSSGVAYTSCEEFADQNKMSSEKIDAIMAAVEQNDRALRIAHSDFIRSKNDFEASLEAYKILNK